jgi:5'-nucleotidase
MNHNKPLILVTNDDGIQSPGIHALARELTPLGEVILVAPREQYSSSGRSHLLSSDGIIEEKTFEFTSAEYKAYAVGGTPAQSVLTGLLQILPRRPDLTVSGINYGENFGTGITVSGTVGAALEAACFGIPAIAVSLQLEDIGGFDKHDPDVDFSTSAFFTRKFSHMILENGLPEQVDLLKIEVPAHANRQTGWRITRLARQMYYVPHFDAGKWQEKGGIGYKINVTRDEVSPDSDIYTVVYDQLVSVTPLTVDMTAGFDLSAWEKSLKQKFQD